MGVMVTDGLVHNPASCGMGRSLEGGSPVASKQECSFSLVYITVHI